MDKNFLNLSKFDANKFLNSKGKLLWIQYHNATANLYFLSSEGKICDVSPSGWWF